MKQFRHVFEFEFLSLIKKKTVKVTTIILCLLSFGAMFVPTIMNMMATPFDVTDVTDREGTTIEVEEFARSIGFVESEYYDLAQAIFPLDHVELYEDVKSIEEDVLSGEIELGLILNSDTDFQLIVKDQGMDSYDYQLVYNILAEIKVSSNLLEAGIDPDDVLTASNVTINSELIVLGKDSMDGYVLGMGIVLLVYMMIILYGQSVAMSVAREKDSRTMELLITSTDAKTLILGKVLSSALFSVAQITLVIICGVIGFYINKGSYPEIIMTMLQGSMDLQTALIYVLFSVSGYIMYLFLYGALGSLVSKVEDVGNSIAPIQVIFVVAYFLATICMNMPNSALSVVSSYIPFTAVFTMPIRFMLTTVNMFEVFISLVLMLGTTCLIVALSVYIYRMGSLNYGNKMKLTTILKGLISKK